MTLTEFARRANSVNVTETPLYLLVAGAAGSSKCCPTILQS